MSAAGSAPGPSEQFLRGAKTGRFLLPRCARCEAWAWPPPEVCPNCASSHWVWEPASGGGVVLAVARVHRGAGEPFQREAPYDLVLVGLEEGPEFITRAASDGLRPGAPVRLEWRTVGGRPWPCAVLTDASHEA